MDPVFTCLDCRACETACPANVQVGGLIEEARGQVRRALPLTGWKGRMSRFSFTGCSPNRDGWKGWGGCFICCGKADSPMWPEKQG